MLLITDLMFSLGFSYLSFFCGAKDKPGRDLELISEANLP